MEVLNRQPIVLPSINHLLKHDSAQAPAIEPQADSSLIPENGKDVRMLAGPDLDYDVLIVGAGLSGIMSLYRMLQMGLRVKVIEAGSAEGGTWFW